MDDSLPLVLTSPGLLATAPSWSPDGRQLAFTGEKEKVVHQIYVVPADGGTPKVLFPDRRLQDGPAWSPDGKVIAFAQFEDATNVPGASIQIFNVATNQVALLPGSARLRSPSWSPDGRFLVAITEDKEKLMLLDLRTRKWTELANATLISHPSWSRDGRDLYYQDLLGSNQPIYASASAITNRS